MTVVVPAQHKGAYQLSQQITTLSARTDTQSVNECKRLQEHLVSTLLADQKIGPASVILSTIAYRAASLPAAISSKITALTTLAAGTTPAALGAAAELDAVQRQAVIELMSNGAMTGASILSTMTYIGGPHS